MKINYYPQINHIIDNIYNKLCGEQAGIMQNNIYASLIDKEDKNNFSIINTIPNYDKVMYGRESQIDFHLSGPGRNIEEALIKLVGEGIERYSLLTNNYLIKDDVTYASYEQIKENGNVIPFELISNYSQENCKKHQKLNILNKDDIIAWIKCPSLFYSNKEIWVPVQMMGISAFTQSKEKEFFVAISKGTAAYTDCKTALLKAILEALEADACMLQWYTMQKVNRIINDDMFLLNEFETLYSDFEVITLDLNFLKEFNVNIIGNIFINKKNEKPFLFYGASADLDPKKAFYKSLIETKSIKYLCETGNLYRTEEFLTKNFNFNNLNSNVAYFASNEDFSIKRNLIHSMLSKKNTLLSELKNYSQKNVDLELKALIKSLKKVSDYAIYYNMTSPEAGERGWYVIKVLIPELLPMSLPGIPQDNHIRMKNFGGIKNNYPHPLP